MVVHKVLHKARLLHNRKLLRELARQDDVVWVVHSPWIFLQLFCALRFSIRNRVIGVYHGPWFLEYSISAAAAKNRVARAIFTFARYLVEVLYSLYVKQFIFLSSGMHRMTSRYLPISASKVHVVPMWSEKNGWDRPQTTREPLILSTFRRLEPRMGLQDFLLALRRCDLKDYRFIICGDGPYRDELHRLIEEFDLRDRVELRGWVTEEEKDALIKRSTAVVIPSRRLEGFSLLALESLEKGTPLLVTEAVGFYEYIRDVQQDFVKIVDLTDARLEVREFLSQGSARRGLDRVQSLFDAERICHILMRIIVPPGQHLLERMETGAAKDTRVTPVSDTSRRRVLHEA